jgi:RAB protein geranylgeranyltransferase component A
MTLDLGAKDVIAKRMADCVGHGMAEKCEVFAVVALKMMTEVYNAGYAAGHHDTVEGYYVTVLDRDKKEYHSGDVEALVSEME